MPSIVSIVKRTIFQLTESILSLCLHIIFSLSKIFSGLANSGLHFKVLGSFKEFIDSQTILISHFSPAHRRKVDMRFSTHNRITHYRAVTFSKKEPEILEWIDKYGSWGPFWDIGANVGLYSVYFGSLWNENIFCFEPSVYNLPSLVRNISINNLSSRAVVVPMALNNETECLPFSVSSLSEGAASNSFGVNYTYDGSPMSAEASFILPGVTANDFSRLFAQNQMPALIKIDVDGIEHLILEGMNDVLLAPGKRTVFIEVNHDFKEQKNRVSELLGKCGYRKIETAQSDMVAASKRSHHTYNEIWIREL